MSGSVRRFLPVAAVVVLAFGCGPGSKGYRVTGRVTFKGQPVPVGKIYFTPDASKGNTGPTGYADIKDGAYDTSVAGGMGFVGGPVVIEIEGFDPNAKAEPDKNDKSGEVLIKSLFPRYDLAAELPKAASTKDVDVPADAVNRQPAKTKVHVGP
ncbi:hypothetical protein J0H58_29830 [bacterium]|nr:hypothetical protein [bacterium]